MFIPGTSSRLPGTRVRRRGQMRRENESTLDTKNETRCYQVYCMYQYLVCCSVLFSRFQGQNAASRQWRRVLRRTLTACLRLCFCCSCCSCWCCCCRCLCCCCCLFFCITFTFQLLGKLWSQVSPLLPPGTCLHFYRG